MDSKFKGGKTKPGTEPVDATAEVVTGAELDEIHETIKAKYPPEFGQFFDQAAELFDEITATEDFVEFLTLPAYELID